MDLSNRGESIHRDTSSNLFKGGNCISPYIDFADDMRLAWFKDYGIENLEQLRHAATTRETPSGRRFEAGSDSVRSGNSAGDNHPMSPNTRVCLEHLDEILSLA